MTNENRVQLQPAFVLHQRAYRDTSAIVDLFTEDYGRVSLVARGARSKRSAYRAILQPYSLLVVSWSGRGELKTLSNAEQKDTPIVLSGDAMISGIYLNEILLRLLPSFDPYEDLFQSYQQTLKALNQSSGQQRALRLFEKQLLSNLGYELNLAVDINSGETVNPAALYYFLPDHGPVRTDLKNQGRQTQFSGRSLLSFSQHELDDEESLRDAKKIMRIALQPLLGTRPLKSRELYRALVNKQHLSLSD